MSNSTSTSESESESESDPKCCYSGCSKPATQTSHGKLVCTGHYNEEHRRDELRRRRRRRRNHPSC